MGATLVYLKDHIRVHVMHKEIGTHVLTSLKPLFKEVCGLAEKVVAIALVVLIMFLFVTAFMKLGDCSKITTSYCEVCNALQTTVIMP